MKLEEFKEVVEIDHPKGGDTWRYVWGEYFTPLYVSSADKDHYLLWFYDELVKAKAFDKKEEDNEETEISVEGTLEVQENPSE